MKKIKPLKYDMKLHLQITLKKCILPFVESISSL